jgi:hypothetical protein
MVLVANNMSQSCGIGIWYELRASVVVTGFYLRLPKSIQVHDGIRDSTGFCRVLRDVHG